MLHQLSYYLHKVTAMASHLDRQHWILISVGVLLLGVVCMKGFGSRTQY